ncbi:MAG: hypothetical protein ACLR56_08490 [Oscillospiraceae bacterium]
MLIIFQTAVSEIRFIALFWQIERPLDLEKINRFCEQITGEHDFHAFSSSGRSVEDTVRRVSLCRAERQGDMIILKSPRTAFFTIW